MRHDLQRVRYARKMYQKGCLVHDPRRNFPHEIATASLFNSETVELSQCMCELGKAALSMHELMNCHVAGSVTEGLYGLPFFYLFPSRSFYGEKPDVKGANSGIITQEATNAYIGT